MSALIVLAGYLIGSIPTAYIAGRFLTGGDIRRMGDANMGAANAFRTLGHKAGVIVFFFDVFKGALAVFIAQKAHLSQTGVLITGIAAVAGHNWPVFLGFRGGRGQSTTIGVLLMTATQPLLITALPAIATLIISKNVILTSVVLFVPLSLIGWWLSLPGILISYSIALPCLVGFTHFLRTRRLPVAKT